MRAGLAVVAVAGALASAGCRHPPGGPEPGPSGSSAAAASQAPGVSVGASRLSKPLAKLSKDDVEAALAKGGWRVTSATETSSGGNRTVLVGASKGPWSATVKVYSHADEFWIHQLAVEQGAVDRDGDAR